MLTCCNCGTFTNTSGAYTCHSCGHVNGSNCEHSKGVLMDFISFSELVSNSGVILEPSEVIALYKTLKVGKGA